MSLDGFVLKTKGAVALLLLTLLPSHVLWGQYAEGAEFSFLQIRAYQKRKRSQHCQALNRLFENSSFCKFPFGSQILVGTRQCTDGAVMPSSTVWGGGGRGAPVHWAIRTPEPWSHSLPLSARFLPGCLLLNQSGQSAATRASSHGCL